MTQALITRQQFSNDQLALVRATVAKGTTPEQFKLFIEVCKHYSLNPFARQIYAVVRGGQMTIQTSIAIYRCLNGHLAATYDGVNLACKWVQAVVLTDFDKELELLRRCAFSDRCTHQGELVIAELLTCD